MLKQEVTQKSGVSLRFIGGVCCSLALALACSGPGNTGLSVISDDLAEQIPWVNGRTPARDDDGNLIIPRVPQYPGIATHKPDIDPIPTDCDAFKRDTKGVEFSTGIWFETFEPRTGTTVGAAEAWAAHDDKTEGSFFTPGEFNAYPDLTGKAGIAWGMPAQLLPGPKCDDTPNDWVFHYQGGRFNRFGAGVEHPIALIAPAKPWRYPEEDPDLPPSVNCPVDPNDSTKPSVVCPPPIPAGAKKDSAGIPVAPTRNDETSYAQTHYYWDLSSYDGISFWARRGPEGVGAFTTIIQDQHTSADLNKENYQYCERIKQCWTTCRNHAPCTENLPGEPGIFRCFDPEEGDLSGLTSGSGYDGSLLDQVAPRCGVSACTSPSTFIDRDMDSEDLLGNPTGVECLPYTFDTHESGEFCFNPDTPPPGSGSRCGDGYAKEVTLTPEWKFYKIRFSELRQQGFGKVSPHMDLTAIHAVAFITPVGWMDFYMDNVSFYREAK